MDGTHLSGYLFHPLEVCLLWTGSSETTSDRTAFPYWLLAMEIEAPLGWQVWQVWKHLYIMQNHNMGC